MLCCDVVGTAVSLPEVDWFMKLSQALVPPFITFCLVCALTVSIVIAP